MVCGRPASPAGRRRRLGPACPAELSAAVQPEMLADAVSVIAELVGNAIRHAQPLPGDVVRVAWSVTRTRAAMQIVEIRVTDGGAATESRDPPTRPGRDRRPRPGHRGGARRARGDVDRDGLGQSVWAELSLPAPSRASADPDSTRVAPGRRPIRASKLTRREQATEILHRNAEPKPAKIRDVFVPRPFEGLADETEWIALRELVPAATAPLRAARRRWPSSSAIVRSRSPPCCRWRGRR